MPNVSATSVHVKNGQNGRVRLALATTELATIDPEVATILLGARMEAVRAIHRLIDRAREGVEGVTGIRAGGQDAIRQDEVLPRLCSSGRWPHASLGMYSSKLPPLMHDLEMILSPLGVGECCYQRNRTGAYLACS